jgi:hypothetical protein
MKQIILDDFSGGQNEVVMPREFSNGQWHQLIGMIANEDGRVETQPAVQRIGSFPSGDPFYKLHSINTSIGTYMLAITRLGRLYWCLAPDANAVYTTANATTWYQITTAENYNWSTTAAGTTKETLVDNPYLHFLCDIPVRAYLYARTPDTTIDAKARAIEYDTDTSNKLNTGQFPGVMINYRSGNAAPSSPQVIVAYVNTRETNPALRMKALVFPNMRRIPTYEVELESAAKDSPRATKHFINGLYLYGKTYEDGVQSEDVVNRWPFGIPSDAPSVRMHPYGYSNVDGANLSGTGIIPRAAVGCAIENKLLLGDIEWRMSADDLPKVPVAPVTIGTVTTVASTISWPTDKGLLNKGRVVYNNGPGTVYLSKDAGVAGDGGAYRQVSVGVSRVSKTGSTCTIVLKKVPDLTSVPSWDSTGSIKVTGVGPNFNGVFAAADSVSLVGSTITFTFNRTGSPTNIANGKRSGKVTFFIAGEGFDIEIPAGDYAALPNDSDWDDFYALSNDTSTIAGLPDRLVARHFLNDNNTGPVRNGIYFSIADIDQFNPTGQIEVSRAGATIAGMHTIDSTIIAVTEGGGETDGVYRIRGSLTLAASDDPTALRIELVKGGIGVFPYGDLVNKDRRSCLWPDAGIVVFVDRMGGVWTTDGNKCDRIDRIGPVAPSLTSSAMLANVAAVGKYLFMRRNGSPAPFNSTSLYCFSIVRSDGSNAQGVWSQISLSTDPKVALNSAVPAGAVVHMQKGDGYTLYSDKALYPQQLTGGQDDLFFIGVLSDNGLVHSNTLAIPGVSDYGTDATGGNVYRLALRGPAAERGKIDNVPVIQIVQTPTLGSETEFDTTNWHTVSTAFVSRGDTYLWGWFASPFSVYPSSVGHIGQGGVGNTFSNTSTPSPNHYYSSAIKAIRQYKQSAHVGQSRMFSYRLYFEGDVVLQSMSVWTTGDVPVDGRST